MNEFNTHINFKEIFNSLIKNHKDSLENNRHQSKCYDDILKFVEHDKKIFELLYDECDYSDNFITFVFGFDFNDANESNNQSTTVNYTIIFDRVFSEFINCDYEQG